MSLSKEDELADLFGDVLRIAGSPEAAKSALRNFLHRGAVNPPSPVVNHPRLHSPRAHRSPTTLSSSSVSTVSTVSTVASPPELALSRLAITPPPEHNPSRPIRNTTPEPITRARTPTRQTPHILPPADNETYEGITPHPRPHPEDIQLTDPTLNRITQHDTTHSPAMFRYIRFMISQNSLYLGEANLNHYRILNSGFSSVPLSVPKRPQDHKPEWWYAVTRGRAIGIYLTWSEAQPLVSGCPGNAHKKFRDFREAVVFIQTALLRGTMEIVPCY